MRASASRASAGVSASIALARRRRRRRSARIVATTRSAQASAQTLLAAEVIGDAAILAFAAAAIVARRGRLEALGAEQVERRADQRRARRLGAQDRGRFAIGHRRKIRASRQINQSID